MTGNEARKALFLVNPSSRTGAASARLAEARLEAAGFQLVPASCVAAKDLSPCIIRHQNDVDCVVLGGGDGTLNAACRGLVETGLPLGVLPLGTANDFARSVGIPFELDAAIRVISDACTHKIDVGVVNGHEFFNVASVGIAADLAKSLTKQEKRRFGRLIYAVRAIRLLIQARPFHATIIDGPDKTMVRTLQVAVGNGRYYGGGNVIVSDARIDGGFLDLYSLEFSQVWRMALMIRSFKAGEHGTVREVRTARGETFELVTRKPRPINTDGELVTETPAQFSQKRQAVTVYVPQTCPLRTVPL